MGSPVKSPHMPFWRVGVVAGLLLATACAHRGDPLQGPRRDSVPLYRAYDGADKIYVRAEVPGAGELVFLVDTGASVSVISDELAATLGLMVQDRGEELVGLGGRTAWRRALLPELRLGRFRFHNVDVAVGVPGVPTQSGLVPVDGLIGNNLWGQLQIAVDYKANRMDLARPGRLPVPGTATPMTFNGQHVSTAVVLVADGTRRAVTLEVDTGARGLVLSGTAGEGLEALCTEGEEVILGVGAGDDVPTDNFIRLTRRVPVTSVELGGGLVQKKLDATWINYDQDQEEFGPPDLRGLIGFDVMEDQHVTFDYAGGRFAVTPSTRRARFHDLHDGLLRSLRGSSTPESVWLRASTYAFQGDLKRAEDLLGRWVMATPDDAKGRVLYARVRRAEGDVAGALDLLRGMDPAALAEEGEIIATVNGLWLAGELDAAAALADAAVAAAPESAEAWVALSDMRRVRGDLSGAREAISRANRLDERPDGHLLRRALISDAEGDAVGTIALTRQLLDRNPTWGASLWLYAMEAAGSADEALCRRDLDEALARLHPGDRPYDFAARARRALGDAEQAGALGLAGKTRDCVEANEPASQANCQAWYSAMTGQDLESADANIAAAMAAHPERSEFIDTAAVLKEVQGDLEQARALSWKAASLSPDDIYLLWQAARLDAAWKASLKAGTAG